MNGKHYLVTLGAVIAASTVAYGGYLGGQTTALWHSIGEIQGQLKCERGATKQ